MTFLGQSVAKTSTFTKSCRDRRCRRIFRRNRFLQRKRFRLLLRISP